MNRTGIILCYFCLLNIVIPFSVSAQGDSSEYLLLATSKTSTMDKEMNEAAGKGYRYVSVRSGNTTSFWESDEIMVIMSRNPEIDTMDKFPSGQYQYKLLATTRPSTMHSELQEAGDLGFKYRGQASFRRSQGHTELICILEQDRNRGPTKYKYLLLATRKTSTMQKELYESGIKGFEFLGISLHNGAATGSELVSILYKQIQ